MRFGCVIQHGLRIVMCRVNMSGAGTEYHVRKRETNYMFTCFFQLHFIVLSYILQPIFLISRLSVKLNKVFTCACLCVRAYIAMLLCGYMLVTAISRCWASLCGFAQ